MHHGITPFLYEQPYAPRLTDRNAVQQAFYANTRLDNLECTISETLHAAAASCSGQLSSQADACRQH